MRPEVPAPTVNQATAALEGRHRVIYGGINRRQRRSYRCASDELSVIHGFNHVAGGRRTADLCAQSAYLRTFLCRLGSVGVHPSRRAKSRARLPHHLQAGKESAGRQVKATESDAMPYPQAARYAAHRIPPVNE